MSFLASESLSDMTLILSNVNFFQSILTDLALFVDLGAFLYWNGPEWTTGMDIMLWN